MIIYFVSMAALLGLVLGSFINALAYRLPRNESLMTRSHCTTCFKQITAWENIPVISWLVLRGRCSGCREPISMRYPLVEFGTAVVFALLTYKALAFGFTLAFAFTALIFLSFAFVGILLSLIDLDTKKLPSHLIYPGYILVLVGALGYQIVTGDSARTASGFLAMAAYLFIYFVMWFVKPGAMGFGDVRLSGLIGFVLGWISFGTAIIGFFLPSVLAIIWMLPSLLRKKSNLKTSIPFGPWMILGALIAIVFGDIFVESYLQLGGLK